MTPEEALSLVRLRGMMLESGSAPEISMVEAVAGEAIRGSWWGHAKGKQIFSITRAIRASPEVLVCRLLEGKITYVHRRLWPGLVRLVPRRAVAGLAQIRETHAPSGRHVTVEIAYPEWVPEPVNLEASLLTEASARTQLGRWAEVVLRLG